MLEQLHHKGLVGSRQRGIAMLVGEENGSIDDGCAYWFAQPSVQHYAWRQVLRQFEGDVE